jgi:hypothetical protein
LRVSYTTLCYSKTNSLNEKMTEKQ